MDPLGVVEGKAEAKRRRRYDLWRIDLDGQWSKVRAGVPMPTTTQLPLGAFMAWPDGGFFVASLRNAIGFDLRPVEEDEEGGEGG